MTMKSSTKKIRDLLLQGYAYSEVHQKTGYPKSEISKQGSALREQGFEPRKRTDEEEKRHLIALMSKGTISEVLDGLSLDQVRSLMSKSLVSWADAIFKEIDR